MCIRVDTQNFRIEMFQIRLADLAYFHPLVMFVHTCMRSIAVAVHNMFRAEQPMALGLSRILFILVLILKN